MALQEHKIVNTIWAFYHKGRFSSFRLSEVAMSEQPGWVKVQDVSTTITFDTAVVPVSLLVEQCDKEIQLMRATAEAAINEKLIERNKLLALENAA
jgi:hypothetical protein